MKVTPRTPLRLLREAPIPGPRPAPEAMSDAELARLARSRDPRAVTLVWNRYAGVVQGIIYRAVGPSHDVEDLVQDVFVGFFKNVGTLRDAGSLRAFLVSISLCTARSALRKRRVRRWLRLSDDGSMPEVPTTGGDPRTHQAMLRLYAILDELDDRGRLAFVLRHAEGYELTETAAALGVSLATIKRALARAEAHVHARSKEDDLLSAWMGEGQ
jgi:RNA polymerase sigma-70 factor (ECF subfamily)